MRPLDAASSLLCNADTPRAPEPAHAWTSPPRLELAAVYQVRAQALATSLGVVPRPSIETQENFRVSSRLRNHPMPFRSGFTPKSELRDGKKLERRDEGTLTLLEGRFGPLGD